MLLESDLNFHFTSLLTASTAYLLLLQFEKIVRKLKKTLLIKGLLSMLSILLFL